MSAPPNPSKVPTLFMGFSGTSKKLCNLGQTDHFTACGAEMFLGKMRLQCVSFPWVVGRGFLHIEPLL